jgi:hypothetical protein
MHKVTEAEKGAYGCNYINLELAKVAEFRRSMADEGQFNVRSVASFLGDFGIGNSMEWNDTERSMLTREADLVSLKSQKDC